MFDALKELAKTLTNYELVFSTKENTHIDHDEEKIYLNPFMELDGFLNHIIKYHHMDNIKEYNPLLVAMLHEIGHEQNIEILTEEDLEEYALINLGLDLIIDDNKKYKFNYDEINLPYYNTTIEWNATEWALDYIKEHENELKDWRIKNV